MKSLNSIKHLTNPIKLESKIIQDLCCGYEYITLDSIYLMLHPHEPMEIHEYRFINNNDDDFETINHLNETGIKYIEIW